jgi:hypothetical protein
MNKMIFCIVFAVFSITSTSHALTWKGVFISGDDSIENFDNGREDLTALFSSIGDLTTVQLSSSQKYISEDNGVYPAVAENLMPAFQLMDVKSNEGCLIHMTSHGVNGQGFYLSLAGVMPPDYLADLVNESCGDAPTVILVSACYSGQFITDSLKGPNRIILTAARADRPSFGCSADTEYTYWDGCLLQEIPNSATWPELYKNVNSCITAKETALGATPSEPQAFFGENTKEWTSLL